VTITECKLTKQVNKQTLIQAAFR